MTKDCKLLTLTQKAIIPDTEVSCYSRGQDIVAHQLYACLVGKYDCSFAKRQCQEIAHDVK